MNILSASATSAETEQLTDFTSGGSSEEVFNPSNSVSQEYMTYTGVDGTGTETQSIANFTAGGSEDQLFDPSSSITYEAYNLTGPNATGTDTSNVFDLASGGSWDEFLSGLPSGEFASWEAFTGPSGTGTNYEDFQNFTFGGSREELFYPSTGETEEILNYTGANATGTDTSNVINKSSGGSEIQSFTVLPSSVYEEDSYYSSSNGTGYETYEAVNQSYGSDDITAGIVYVYNSSGQLIGKNETAYAFGETVGYANYNLLTNQVTYEEDSATKTPYPFDPGYDESTNTFSSSSGMVDTSNLYLLGCGGMTLDSDGDYDNDPLLISMNGQNINLLPVGKVSFDFWARVRRRRQGGWERTPECWCLTQMAREFSVRAQRLFGGSGHSPRSIPITMGS